MLNVGNDIKLCLLKAMSILLTLFVIIMISSCSSEVPQLCNVGITLEEDYSRTLSAEINPLKNYTIYYKSIYRGSDPSKAYGDMSNSSSFNKLTSSGILVSQGLWEIQAIFKETGQDDTDTYTPTKGELIASSGNIYINLNTQSIAVSFTSNEGYVRLTQYELRNVPNSITDASISVNAYKYNTETSSFDSTAIPLTLQQSEKLKSGVYYAVVEVKGTVSNTSKTLFTDCIGFVVRSGFTTKISGYCNTYNSTGSSGGGSFIVIDKPTDEQKPNVSEIKNFIGEDFKNNGTYTITDKKYYLIPGDTTDTEKTNKELIKGQDISINMNGYAIVNSNKSVKTSFTINEGASLTIINDNENNSKDPKTFGYGGSPSDADKNPNFSINGGTLTLGSTDSSVEGSIDLKGGPCSLNSSGIKHAAVVVTSKGGTINLLSPGNGSYVNIEETTIGISTAFNETSKYQGDDMNININMVNASIHVTADSNDYATGIRLDGTKNDSKNYGGTININIKGTGDDGDSILTSYDKKGNGVGISIENSCIYIMNYAGSINISIDENAYLLSKKGYAIALVNCTGDVRIDNKGTTLGSITFNNQGDEEYGNAIYLDNCRNVRIYNSGTLSADSSSYQVYSANSTVTFIDSDGNVIDTYDKIYSTNTSLYRR